jgi:nanoRNase/pAp phosphatase (c-di-AMP/oligoRNAs hydrolase)
MTKSQRAYPRPDKIWELLKAPVVIVSHSNVDVDGAACMLAFASELKKRKIEFQLIAPQDVSKAAEKLAENSGYKIEVDSKPQGNSTLVLDVLSPEQIEPYKFEDLPKPVIVIDHHYYNPDWEQSDLYYFFETKSCAETLLDFFNPDKETAQVLLTGIMTDTGMFKYADKKTFEAVLKLHELGADVESSLKLIDTGSDQSEKIAILKAASKMDYTRENGRLIVATKAGSFESSVASSLIRLGADVAIVASDKKGYTRISVRSRDIGIHLGKIMEQLGKKFGGSGGGHERAAVLEAPSPAIELLNKVKKEIQRVI